MTVCVIGCSSEAIKMEYKPDFPVPPKNNEELMAELGGSGI